VAVFYCAQAFLRNSENMKNMKKNSAKILELSAERRSNYTQPNKHLNNTPILTLDYADAQFNQQEMEDYIDSLPAMIPHSDATPISDTGLVASHPRSDARRILDASLMQFDLDGEIEKIKHEKNWMEGCQSAKTLVKSENMSLLLIAMHMGDEMKMHRFNGPITLHVVEGNIQFLTRQNCVSIKEGQLITLQKKIPHNLVAKMSSIFLLTLLNLPDEKQEDGEDLTEKEIEKKDKETIEQSENINFPDFPTYPARDDIYKEPAETAPNDQVIT
jgi:quercetin dioxygenase-like cupin family protein